MLTVFFLVSYLICGEFEVKKETSLLLYKRVGRCPQSQKNPVGVSALPTGKFLRVWKVFARTTLSPKQVKTWHMFLDSLESFLTVWKVSGQSGEYLESLESFRKDWKVSGVWKVFRQSGKFSDRLESFRIAL